MMIKKINAFTSIRFFWAMSIVFTHIYLSYRNIYDFSGFNFLIHGGFGVSSFFILSGFLVCMHYGDDFYERTGIYHGIIFLLRHIKKWYLLHIVCMIPFVVITLIRIGFSWELIELFKLLIKILLNLLLVQSWIPGRELSLNGVAWYLSCLSAIYLITPILLNLNGKIRNKLWLVTLLSLMCLTFIYLVGDKFNILYSHPIYRIHQFTLGILLYDLRKAFNMKIPCVFNYLSLLFQLIAYIMIFNGVVSLLDSLSTIVFIFIFYNSYEYKVFTNSKMIKLGNISLEIFLMHYPIVVYGSIIFRRIIPFQNSILLVEMLVLMIISLVTALAYNNYFRHLKFMAKQNQNLNFYIDYLIKKIISAVPGSEYTELREPPIPIK